jgi:hypothetical protein
MVTRTAGPLIHGVVPARARALTTRTMVEPADGVTTCRPARS